MKILVTGAGGKLGTDLVSRLVPQHPLMGVGRRPAPHLHIPFHVVNLVDPKAARDLIEKEKPEVVLHAAAMTDVDHCETDRPSALRGNLETTRNVTEASNRVGALVIFFGTDFIFDGTQPTPYREDDPPHPINVYGETKLLAERYLLLRAKRFLILRTSWLFGRQGDDFPKKILKQAEGGKPIPIICDQFGNPTFSGDLAEAVAQIIELLPRSREKENQIYHLTNEGAVSRYEFAREILKKKNFSTELLSPIPNQEVRAVARRPQNSVLSIEKIKARFGIRLRRWEEALDAYFQESFSAKVSL